MAHYHASVKAGPKGTGASHAQYIERGGRFTAEKYGAIGESEPGNLPAWAGGSAARFFAAADEHERANGNAYREFELALPVELSEPERGRLVREFVAEQLGSRHAYLWAIHEPKGHNPHVHIMFSERLVDGLERSQEQYFKRANKQHPELGGHLKSDWFTGKGGPEAVEAVRARWAEVQNLALERAGIEARVDHRSLEAQGLEREAGQHRGPAVSGIEERGEVAEVSVRREAERGVREASVECGSGEVLERVREVSREEVAAERLAARERRELLPEVSGELKEDLSRQVEADRREQIERVVAQAERRIERRQEIGGRWGERLLEQARQLRDRVLELGGRVREWVQGLMAGREAKQALAAGLESKTPARDRGLEPADRFIGLELGSAREGLEKDRFAGLTLAAGTDRPARSPAAGRKLDRALSGYASAVADIGRMHGERLPVLEHQRVELERAGGALEALRPGASRDLDLAFFYQPDTRRALGMRPGRERRELLRQGLEREEQYRAAPGSQAERVVSRWRAIEQEYGRLRGEKHRAGREVLEADLKFMVRQIKTDPALEQALQARERTLESKRGQELSLARVIREKTLERALELAAPDRERSQGMGLGM